MATRIYFPQGDTAVFDVTVAEVADLEDYDITFTIKRSAHDSDAGAVWQGTTGLGDIEVTSATVCRVTVPREFTRLLRTGRLFYWDLQLEDIEGQQFSPCGGTILTTTEVTLG